MATTVTENIVLMTTTLKDSHTVLREKIFSN